MRLAQFITRISSRFWSSRKHSPRRCWRRDDDGIACATTRGRSLQAVAEDIETNQTDLEQAYKSQGFVPIAEATRTAAMTHGALRHLAGFDLRQLAAEFARCGRGVLRLWLKRGAQDATAFYQMTRFNESIDQALAKSIANFWMKWRARGTPSARFGATCATFRRSATPACTSGHQDCCPAEHRSKRSGASPAARR